MTEKIVRLRRLLSSQVLSSPFRDFSNYAQSLASGGTVRLRPGSLAEMYSPDKTIE